MRDLELLGEYLVRLRQERLQQGHTRALDGKSTLTDIQICAHEAELCSRMLGAVKVLAHDAGKFIEEFLPVRERT